VIRNLLGESIQQRRWKLALKRAGVQVAKSSVIEYVWQAVSAWLAELSSQSNLSQ